MDFLPLLRRVLLAALATGVTAGAVSEGRRATIELALDEETLSGVLAESAAEVASLVEALRG